jgi:threonine-phosphate decarboxylase
MNAVHGGDVESVAAWSGHRPTDLLDFSANINPLGPPDSVRRTLAEAARETAWLSRYPDPLYRELRAALARELGIDAECIAVGNGSAALLDAAIRRFRARRCLLPVPAFSEYRKALEQNAVELVMHRLDPAAAFRLDLDACVRAAAAAACDLCVVSNPHNPSGSHLSRAEVLELEARLRSARCSLVVDEAFVDYVLEASISAEACELPETVVLRSLTKFYAIPAIRVGYAVARAKAAREIAAWLPSWPVGSLASRVAIAVLGERVYARRTIVANAEARQALLTSLRAIGLRVFPSAANFLLIDLGETGELADRLRERLIREHGIVVRSCSDYEVLREGAYVRVAVRGPDENRRLVEAIANLLPTRR